MTRVLFICHGNICRSVMAEYMMRYFIKEQGREAEFQIDSEEWDFYDALTRYVEDQSIKAAADDSARGRALGFTMAMLQRSTSHNAI